MESAVRYSVPVNVNKFRFDYLLQVAHRSAFQASANLFAGSIYGNRMAHRRLDLFFSTYWPLGQSNKYANKLNKKFIFTEILKSPIPGQINIMFMDWNIFRT